MAVNGFPMYGMGSQGMGMAPFRFFCQTVLPAVFDDSLSYYEVVCKVAEKLNEEIKRGNDQGEGIKELQVFVMGLQKQLDEFKESGFDDYYKEQVQAWIDAHLDDIFGRVVKQVYFGLTLDGHFVAYIPDGWSDITFDTGAVYGLDDYGRLILRWLVDGSAKPVDQTREVVRDGNGINVSAMIEAVKKELTKLILTEGDERIDEDDELLKSLRNEYDDRVSQFNDLQNQINEIKAKLN